MIDGYERKKEILKFQKTEAWRRTRLISYCAAKPYIPIKNLSIYDFLPLENDPTEEQQLEALSIKKEEEGQYIRALLDKHKKIK